MADATLKVPAQYTKAFRTGLLHELVFDGEWIKGQADEADRWIAQGKTTNALDHLGGPLADVEVHARLLRQVDAVSPGQDIEIKAGAEVLRRCLQAIVKESADHMLEQPEDLAAAAWAAGEAVTV